MTDGMLTSNAKGAAHSAWGFLTGEWINTGAEGVGIFQSLVKHLIGYEDAADPLSTFETSFYRPGSINPDVAGGIETEPTVVIRRTSGSLAGRVIATAWIEAGRFYWED